MSTHRLFNLFVVLALVAIVALTVREAAATSSIIPKTNSADQSLIECASLPSRYSIHSEYVKEMGAWITYSEDGHTGFDSGLIQLLSNYRTCR